MLLRPLEKIKDMIKLLKLLFSSSNSQLELTKERETSPKADEELSYQPNIQIKLQETHYEGPYNKSKGSRHAVKTRATNQRVGTSC
ncbi:hypothetical protein LIER_32819 [Lithospermum erythrorhizon]|uniref:Uncharacterized protein n=1 Tax=Lithospermum erythrorhizon TaxID=34254 RepID=A0AAV3S0R6_LITER